jgi:L-amino acid N-acyltransferase YncA
MVPLVVREATEEEWPQIYPIFSAVVAAGDSYAYPEGLTALAAHEWWFEPGGRVTVAVRDGSIIGTAKMGANRPGRGSHVATASFMVDPTARRSGAGRALGEEMIAWATATGYRAIQFNAVVETNEPARALWAQLGFRTLTVVPEAFEHRDLGLVGLCVLHRSLTRDP